MLSPFVCKFWLLIWPNLCGYLASMKATVCLWKYAFWKLIVFIPHLFSGANLLLVYKSLGISEDFIPHREFKFTIGKKWCKNPWHFTFHLLDSQNAGGIPSIEYPQMPKDRPQRLICRHHQSGPQNVPWDLVISASFRPKKTSPFWIFCKDPDMS